MEFVRICKGRMSFKCVCFNLIAILIGKFKINYLLLYERKIIRLLKNFHYLNSLCHD